MIYSAPVGKVRPAGQSEEAKLEMSCATRTRPGPAPARDRCGWGGFARYAAENYGVSVVGVTISSEQRDLGSRLPGLPVEIRLQDYREIRDSSSASSFGC